MEWIGWGGVGGVDRVEGWGGVDRVWWGGVDRVG